MLQLLIAGLVVLACFFWIRWAMKDDRDIIVLGWINAVLFGIWLVICLFRLSLGPAEDRSKLKQMEAARTTIQQQRLDSLTAFERVQLTQTIISWNTWLAEAQFWTTIIHGQIYTMTDQF